MNNPHPPTIAELEALIAAANTARYAQLTAPTEAQRRAARALVERLIDRVLGRST